jgi:hypothetical protein
LNRAKLQFSGEGSFFAVAAGMTGITVCVVGAFDSLLFFVPRYEEAGGLRPGLLRELNYATDGWLGFILLAACAAFCVPFFWSAVYRLFTSQAAMELTDHHILVHPSFLMADRQISYSAIKSITLTTEGEAMQNRSQKLVRAATPFGSGWVVRQSEQKICVIVRYSGVCGREKKVKISAQFIERGKWALGDFVKALRNRVPDIT